MFYLVKIINKIIVSSRNLKQVSHFFLSMDIDNKEFKILLESKPLHRFLFLSQMFLSDALLSLKSKKTEKIFCAIVLFGGLASILSGSTIPFWLSCFLGFAMIAYIAAIEFSLLTLFTGIFDGGGDDDPEENLDPPYENLDARSKSEHLFFYNI